MKQPLILAYHRVLPTDLAQSRGQLAVTVENFERQIAWLANRGWRSVTLEELVKGFDLGEGKFSRKTVVVTFDDGYQDNYYFAFPILKKYNFKATIFLVGYAYRNRSFELYFNDPNEKRYKLNKFDEPLTLTQINEMLKWGFEFASHSLTHPRLSALNMEELEIELVQSKVTLENVFHRQIISFCYPFGDLNADVIAAVQRAGYSAAVVTPPRTGIPETQFTIHRTGVYLNDSLLKFRIKCSKSFYVMRKVGLIHFCKKYLWKFS